MSEIRWVQIHPGTAWLGDDRGALMHAGNSPRHQIKISSAFEISSEPITFAQWKSLTGNATAGQDSDLPLNRLTPLMIEAGLIGTDGNLRPPSEAEWALADAQGAIGRGPVQVEVLSDRPPRSGYWGAPCDGRPWLPPVRAGGISDHTAHVTRIWQSEGTVRGTTPRGVSRQKMGFRLVRFAEYNGDLKMPNAPQKSSIILREALIALLIGIIPSFIWAYFNASSEYISSSWLNIAFGGVFFSLMTALVWRPKTPCFHVAEDNTMRQD
ncbi:MAG: hypothetical protein VYA86_00355 [Candidatus Thermoplasmatota archaeon]|nr:hypothetical protein [Candidatus Thermoplasmatota archaeon]